MSKTINRKQRTSPFLAMVSFLALTAAAAFGQNVVTAPATATVESTVLVEYAGEGLDNGRITLGTEAGIPLVGANPAELSGDKTGSVNLVMPSEPGAYSIIYYAGTTTLATREIVVTPVGYVAPVLEAVEPIVPIAELVPLPADGEPQAISVTLKAPVSVVSGYSFEVVWAGPSATGDLLALVDPGAPDTVVSYTYLNPINPRAVLRTEGTSAGEHEIQYRNGAGEALATQRIDIKGAPVELVSLTVAAEKTAAFGSANAVSVILDASGSMLQDEGGEDRIDTAKDTLLTFMRESLPEGTPFSLRAFGHIEEGSCESELLIPLSPLDYAGMSPIVRNVEAINLAKTPIAASLEKVISDFDGVTGSRTVVLLTDGEETCEGDPAAVIRSLRANNKNVRVNIVGYAIEEDKLRQTFESWAAIGDGRYFDAPKGTELATALQGAVAIPYAIYSADILVATGVTGATSHRLAPGAYTVVYNTGGQEKITKNIILAADTANEVMLP